MGATPQVAISADFLKAFSSIPRSQQKKVRAFMEKFKSDPTQASIDYEPIRDMLDEKVRTVRIDQAWRAVIIHPPQGDVYLCVWVDHHDEAHAWAKNKRFEVNAHTGSFQVWEPVAGKEEQPTRVATVGQEVIPEERLLSGYADDDLLLLGVPEPLIPAVRALRTEEDLDELSRYLPDEATDGLYLLAAGYSLDESLEEMDRNNAAKEKEAASTIDTDNFVVALERPGSGRSFKLVTEDEDLQEILNASLDQWRIFLHPNQRKLVEMNSTGPVRVLGGAGTGKTVVAMHRARHLAKTLCTEPKDRILFTTFTRNLAGDIQRNLKNLCGPELERIEVFNLDRWAGSFLRSRGAEFTITDNKPWEAFCSETDLRGYSESFLRDEWEKVIQAQDVADLNGYLRARRVGRGTRLSRQQRKEVWELLEGYRRRLKEKGQMEYADVIREARSILEKTPELLAYKAVVADEVQDLSHSYLRLIRAIVPEGPNDVFVVGDAHQRIYGHRAGLSRAGINIRGRRSRRLKINYRTTQHIRNWAVALLKGIEVDDLDEELDTLKGYRSLRVGDLPEINHCQTAQQEADLIVDRITSWNKSGVDFNGICIAVRSKSLRDRYEEILKQAEIPTVLISRSVEEDLGAGVRIATMHRVKGLEFCCMILASIHKGDMPKQKPDHEFPDAAAKKAFLESEKQLLYVAATRARDALLVTGFGTPSIWT